MGLPETTRTISPWRGWGPIIVLPVAVLLLTPPEWPRWLFMWVLAFVIFVGCKWLTWRRTPAEGLPWWRHAGYLLAWPGLDANAFLRSERMPTKERPALREWGVAGLKLLLGAVIFWGLSRLVPERQEILLGWIGMAGLILMLHFGSFHLLSCAWRAIGVEARPLMNDPLASVRVSEFWGKRWNTAFRDLTHRFLFRPLTDKLGPRWAILAGFVFSGLVHDLVISVPANGGYGGPTLFFVVQAVALLGERSRLGQAVGLGHGWRGRLFTIIVLALPAYRLFHPPFVENIIVPFMRALGAT
jgi:hypothetical protein